MTIALTAPRAALFYTVASVAMTWPLVTRFGSAMPADLGDPLLNAWILTWGAEHFTEILTGDPAAFGRWCRCRARSGLEPELCPQSWRWSEIREWLSQYHLYK